MNKIHKLHDGRGNRDVFVNGNKVSEVTFADEDSGVVWFYPEPVRVMRHNNQELYKRKLKGVVTVRFHNES